MTKVITFTAPKTAGSTLLSSNLGIVHQWRMPQQKVGFLQLDKFPDVHHYLGVERRRSFGDLVSFWNTEEWNLGLIEKVVKKQGIEIIQSPDLSEWKNLNVEFFGAFFQFLLQRYDVLYVDYDSSLESEFLEIVFESVTQNILVLSMNPGSLGAVDQFLKTYPHISECSGILINQVSKSEKGEVEQVFKGLDINCLGTVPRDEKALWHQVYEGVPVVMQKRSKSGKALEQLIDHFLTHS